MKKKPFVYRLFQRVVKIPNKPKKLAGIISALVAVHFVFSVYHGALIADASRLIDLAAGRRADLARVEVVYLNLTNNVTIEHAKEIGLLGLQEEMEYIEKTRVSANILHDGF